MKEKTEVVSSSWKRRIWVCLVDTRYVARVSCDLFLFCSWWKSEILATCLYNLADELQRPSMLIPNYLLIMDNVIF